MRPHRMEIAARIICETKAFSLLMMVSLLASMVLVGTAKAQYQPGVDPVFFIKLPNGGQLMSVTTAEYDIGDKFNITVSLHNVTEMTAYGVTIMWNATFQNTTGRWWLSDFFMGEWLAGRWYGPLVGYIGNDLRTQPGKEALPPHIGAFVGYGQTALGPQNNVTGSYDICTIEFQVNAYGPLWFYVWKDPANGYVGHYEGIFPEVTPPITYSGWMGLPPPGVRKDYDVVWAPGYEDEANAMLEVKPQPPPVGGKATTINIPMNKPELQTTWIWLSAIILSLVLTVLYVKKRKRDTEINS